MATTTRILMMRHEDHKDNMLLPEAFERAVVRGRDLKERHYQIDIVVSSPQWRCVQTCMAVLQGFGSMVPLAGLEPKLGDIALDKSVSKEWSVRLKAIATEKYGDASDSNLARAMVEHEEFHEVVMRRAKEGAEALHTIVELYAGMTILVCSHGVARIEPSLNWFAGLEGTKSINIMSQLFARGEIKKITMADGKFVDIRGLS